jgi:hypothetical protein
MPDRTALNLYQEMLLDSETGIVVCDPDFAQIRA